MRNLLILALVIVAVGAHNDDNQTPDNASEALRQEDTASLMSRTHNDRELIAQSICSTIVGVGQGWIYAVERSCSTSSTQTCTDVCTDTSLHSQDSQTNGKKWMNAGAIHVYSGRPSTSIGKLGLKVLRYGLNRSGCGPDFCCCYVPM